MDCQLWTILQRNLKKPISKLQYITQETEGLSHVEAAKNACEAGCDWVQLRIKHKAEEEVLQIAQEVKQICVQHQATFVMNDYVAVAKAVQADGVHLGKEDMLPVKAREILGEQVIIGGTGNTFEDVQKLAEAKVDYMGIGPFRFTTTKQKLSPILGLEGYQVLIEKCLDQNINIPIVAIGGIVAKDVAAIMQTGVHGIAVSGLLTQATNQHQLIQHLQEILIN